MDTEGLQLSDRLGFLPSELRAHALFERHRRHAAIVEASLAFSSCHCLDLMY